MRKFVIHISGQSCSGKSTVFQALAKQYPGSYLISYDKQKWQLSGYHRDKDKDTVQQIIFGLFEVVCKMGLPILQDFGFLEKKDAAQYLRYKELIATHGYRVVSVMLTAPQEVLIERFRQRVESAKRTGTRVSVDNEALFIANLTKSVWLVPEDALTFDTSVTSAEEVCKMIQQKLDEGK